jgi:hypothetical protein
VFDLCGHSYKLGVTDPRVECHFLNRADGDTPLDDALICVSLGEVFHGFAYKLAASVIRQPAGE